MDLKKFKKRLTKYKEKDIIFTDHSKIQAFVRQIDLQEIKKNISNPERLVYYGQQESNKPNEEKYECYFAYSSTYYHKYVLVMNGKVIICTVIKVNRKWQRRAEKHARG